LLEDGEEFGLGHHVGQVGVLLLEVLEVSFVVHFLILLLPDLLDLVVVDVELLPVEELLVEGSLGLRGGLGVLEADEGIHSLSFLGEHLDALDFSIAAEEFLELVVGGLRREVLDVEVATFLAVFVPHHLLLLLDFSLLLVQGSLHVPGVAFVDALAVQVLNRISSAL